MKRIEKSGTIQLLEEIELQELDLSTLEAIRISGDDHEETKIIGGLYTNPAEFPQILDLLGPFAVERGFGDDWDRPTVYLTLWFPDLIIYTHEYDSSLTLRAMDRNPA